MHKLKAFLQKRFSTFQAKLKLAFILTSMIPLLLSVFIALSIINSYLEKDARRTFFTNASLEAQQIESKLQQIIRLQESLSAFFSTSLYQNKEISSASLARFQAIRANVTSSEYVYGIDRIRIYSDMIPFTSGDSFHFFPIKSLDSSLLEEISNTPFGANRLNILYPENTPSTVSFYKVLKNIKGEIIAIYFIDINFRTTIDQLSLPSRDIASLAIIENGTARYRSTTDFEISQFPENYSADKVYSIGNSEYQLIKNSAFTDWTYIFRASKGSLQKVNLALFTGYALIFAFTVILCIVAIIFLPDALSKRIKYFSQVLNNIPDEDLTSSSATERVLDSLTRNTFYKDEIDHIIDSFHDLFRKNILLNSAVQKHLLEIEHSKFIILQEQINPHFLYNSLDTIRICMLMDKKDTACRLITALSQFYRISLSKGRDIISLEDELNMISSYLQIEYIGYDEHITWKFSYTPDLLDCGIPKFTLQPIVENSIVHSDFSCPDFHLCINIDVSILDDCLCIEVSDNGPGISKQQLEQINMVLSSKELTHTKNYGLQNCCHRIRLHYGAEYGLSLIDTNSGSCTRIILPVHLLDEIKTSQKIT